MARTKNYKDGELEKEFGLFCYYHKLVTIAFALKLEDSQIYKHRLLEDKYEEASKEYEDKIDIADAIVDMFIEQHDNGDDTELNEVYKYCWEFIVPRIEDNLNYTEGQTKRSLF